MYYEQGKGSPHYEEYVALIKELFSLLPEKQRKLLTWDGP